MLEIYNFAYLHDMLLWTFMLFPHFTFSMSFLNLNRIEATKRACSDLCNELSICTPQLLCASEPQCCGKQSYSKLHSFCFYFYSDEISNYFVFFRLTGIIFIRLTTDRSYFAWEEPGIGRNVVYFVVSAIVGFTILMIIEYRLLNNVIYRIMEWWQRKSRPPTCDNFIDADVCAEKMRVDTMWMHEIAAHNLVLKDVTKYYQSFLAVNQLSIVVDK